MNENEALAQRFEANRSHLTAVAYRMLGSTGEAEDAVQEAWLRLSRSDTSEVDNLGGWLTTVVARVCLDMLRSRKARREEPLPAATAEPVATRKEGIDPEYEAVLADSVGLALLVVLGRLAPAERVAFVLHDMFDLSFDEIAPIVNRSPTAARQLASRARRRVRGADVSDTDRSPQRELVDAFLAAARGGDMAALIAVLDPDVVVRADRSVVEWAESRAGAGVPRLAPEIRGAAAVAQAFSGTARNARLALVNGAAALVWTPDGQPRSAMSFTILRGKIVAIDLLADPERIRHLNIELLSD